MTDYIARTFTLHEPNATKSLDEAQMVAMEKPIVILAEPGMGKTTLLRHLQKLPGYVFCTASKFVNLSNPAVLAKTGSTLLIDGLDELAAANENDPINRVLAKLLDAGYPPFVLTCRAVEWRGAVALADIADQYGRQPTVLWLERFQRADAVRFLTPDLGAEPAEQLVAALEQRRLPDLYGNPLSLKLFSAVAQNGDLPETRPELLARACEKLWPEANDRNSSPLTKLDTDAALSAVGAMAAALILTGSDTIASLPSVASKGEALSLGSVLALPGGEHAEALLKSRLFVPVPEVDGTFKPIHRTIAEYLGAHWLARQATDDLACDRLLAMLTVDAGVPASLRGLYAWLVTDPRLAPRVIDLDPYGVLAYGDADNLTVEQGRRLLRALQRIQKVDPYFRASDWSSPAARGLTHIELLDDVRSLLLSEDTSFHLRTLILGIVLDSPLAPHLARDLTTILRNTDARKFSYAERHDAAQILAQLDDQKTALATIVDELITAGDEDACRLALDIIQLLTYAGFDAMKIAVAVVAHLGLTAGGGQLHRRSTSLFGPSRTIPDILIASVLDELIGLLPARDPIRDPEVPFELESFVSHLIARQLPISPPMPTQLLAWMRLIASYPGYRSDDRKPLANFISQNHQLRRAIQHELLFEGAASMPSNPSWHITAINSALAFTSDDIVYHLQELAKQAEPDSTSVAVWQNLANFGPAFSDAAQAILDAARPFANGNPNLEAHLNEIYRPAPPPPWLIERQQKLERFEQERRDQRAKHRAHFSRHKEQLTAGDLNYTLPTAQAYLGLFSDIDNKLPPPDRLTDWLGSELKDSALAGFEATLSRSDLPSPRQVADDYAQNKTWNIVHPLIAAVAERVQADRALDDITPDTLLTTALAVSNGVFGERIDQSKVLGAVEGELRKDPHRFEQYVRLSVEPFLLTGDSSIRGLYHFAQAKPRTPLQPRLAAEWLASYPDLPAPVEAELVHVLIAADGTAELQRLCRERAARDIADPERRLNWRAIGLIANFSETSQTLIAADLADRTLLWHLREFAGYERGGVHPLNALSPEVLAWIITTFRKLWPRARMPGSAMGNTNPWDATEFIDTLITRLASDTSESAAACLESLAQAEPDGYTDFIRHNRNAQRRAHRDGAFSGIALSQLKAVLKGQTPETTNDILAVVQFALAHLQAQLRGNNTDTVDKYWTDDGQPRLEDRCTDLLTEDLDRLMPVPGIVVTPQADMPKGKAADIAYAVRDAELPVECKGQWHRDLWTAATDQLDKLYVANWRSQGTGLLIVYWFGTDVQKSRKLRKPPSGEPVPRTPDELRAALKMTLPPERREAIAIEVIDFTRS